MPDSVVNGRRKNGQLMPGFTANPSGKNGKSYWQAYGIRSQYWLERLNVETLRALIKDSHAFGKLSSYDAMIIRHLANIIFDRNPGPERERLLNRIEGKPKPYGVVGREAYDAAFKVSLIEAEQTYKQLCKNISNNQDDG